MLINISGRVINILNYHLIAFLATSSNISFILWLLWIRKVVVLSGVSINICEVFQRVNQELASQHASELTGLTLNGTQEEGHQATDQLERCAMPDAEVTQQRLLDSILQSRDL